MFKMKEKPKIDFSRNKMLRKIFQNYASTFSLTLDTEDFMNRKYIDKFNKYVWKDMRKNLRKIPILSRNMKKWMKLQLQAVKDKAESEQSERIKSESGLCSALDRQNSKEDLKCQARAYINPCLLDCRFILCSPTKLAGVCCALANTPAVGDKVQC